MRIVIHFFLTFLLVVPFISYGQVIPFISYRQADTIYYDEEGRRAEFDNADYYRVIENIQDNKYKVKDYYLNSKLKMSGYYISLDTNYANSSGYSLEVADGSFIYYDEKGNKTSEGNIEKNKRTGEWRYYYASSNEIWYIVHYENGALYGELTSYYKGGKLKRREQHQLKDASVKGECYDEQSNEIRFTQFETMPKALFNLSDYLSKNLVYPARARNKNIEGRVIVKFVVNEDGTISNVKTVKQIGGGCDEEAVRVVSAMPNWEPGIQDDKKVKVFFTLPIVFKLKD